MTSPDYQRLTESAHNQPMLSAPWPRWQYRTLKGLFSGQFHCPCRSHQLQVYRECVLIVDGRGGIVGGVRSGTMAVTSLLGMTSGHGVQGRLSPWRGADCHKQCNIEPKSGILPLPDTQWAASQGDWNASKPNSKDIPPTSPSCSYSTSKLNRWFLPTRWKGRHVHNSAWDLSHPFYRKVTVLSTINI